MGSLGILLLILDSRTALTGAAEGMELCCKTVIPSLFPFFVLSGLVNSALMGKKLPLLGPLGRLCGIPAGSESMLLLGLIGGYPVGAQSIYQARRVGQLSPQDARRMLGFCNNAGPAFIFGMTAALFSSRLIPWVLLLLQCVSAILTGILLPGKSRAAGTPPSAEPLTISQSLERGVRIMASVCGWVVLFRVILAFCQRWFLWLLPRETEIFVCGLLELSNGCIELLKIPSQGLRFLLCSCFLSMGGLCVAMQTASAVRELGVGTYFPGKVLQASISLLLASLVQPLLFQSSERVSASGWLSLLLLVPCAGILFHSCRKKVVAIHPSLVYNS